MRKRLMVGFVALAVLSVAVTAKPKSHTFKAEPAQVYAAAVRSISSHYKIQYTDEKTGIISFKTGMSMSAVGLDCNASIRLGKGSGETEMVINVQKTGGQMLAWGAGDRLAADIFKWVQEDLNEKKKD